MTAAEMRALLRKAALSKKHSPELMAEDSIEESVGPLELALGTGMAAREGLATGIRSLAMNAVKKEGSNQVAKTFGKVVLRDEVSNKVLPPSELLKARASEAAKKVILRVDGKDVPTTSLLQRDSLGKIINSKR